jgi:hypothetical protein
MPDYQLHIGTVRGASAPVNGDTTFPPGQYYIRLEGVDAKVHHVTFKVDGIKYREVHAPYEVIPPPWLISATHAVEWQVKSAKATLVASIDDTVNPVPDPPADPPRAYFIDLSPDNEEDDPIEAGDEYIAGAYTALLSPYTDFPTDVTRVEFTVDGVAQPIEYLEPYTIATVTVVAGTSHTIGWTVYSVQETTTGSITFSGVAAPGTADPAPPPQPAPPEPDLPGDLDAGQTTAVQRILGGVPFLQPTWSTLIAFGTNYDTLFDQWGDHHQAVQEARQAASGDGWVYTYYDRALLWYGAWWRTNDPEMLARAIYCVEQYREQYVLPNNGQVPPRWAFTEGLACDHIISGSARSLDAVKKIANRMQYWINLPQDTQYRDGRIQGRAIDAQIIAAELTTGSEQTFYQNQALLGINDLITWYDLAGGNGPWDSEAISSITNTGNYCGGMATFQIAHAILRSMVRYHRLISPIARMSEILTETCDLMYDTYWTVSTGFSYIQPPASHPGGAFTCTASGSDSPAVDLNLLIATIFGDAYNITGLTRFKTYGDEVFAEGISGSIYMNGHKQFNESFMRSWQYPYYRSL